MIIGRRIEDLTYDVILKEIERQAQQGVDYFTIHAGVLREHLPLIAKRIDRHRLARRLAARQVDDRPRQAEPDVRAVRRDLRHHARVRRDLLARRRPAPRLPRRRLATRRSSPSCTRSASSCSARARRVCRRWSKARATCRSIRSRYNMKLQQRVCDDAPFYVLGPLVTDVFPGYDHITSAIGATEAARARRGDALLRHAEGARRPAESRRREGTAASRTRSPRTPATSRAASPGARQWDDDLSRARAALNWPQQFELAFDGETARALHDEDLDVDTDFCAMCGHDWCSMRISKEIEEFASGKDPNFQPDRRVQRSPGISKRGARSAQGDRR